MPSYLMVLMSCLHVRNCLYQVMGSRTCIHNGNLSLKFHRVMTPTISGHLPSGSNLGDTSTASFFRVVPKVEAVDILTDGVVFARLKSNT